MPSAPAHISHRPLTLLLLLLLTLGFLATSLASYYSAFDSIRSGIVDTELPLTSDTIYSEIQTDLVRPVLIASMMAQDIYIRDWLLSGEAPSPSITRYLHEVQTRYGTLTSFLVADKSRTYYQAKGVLKQVSPEAFRDIWYYDLKRSDQPYAINIDVDLANQDRLAVFINYKVLDYQGNFIGATGVGLQVDTIAKLIETYQQRYQRRVFFTDSNGRLVLTGAQGGPMASRSGQLLSELPGLESFTADKLKAPSGTYSYEYQGQDHLLNVRFIPELNWYLFVDKEDEREVAGIRKSLYLNLLICLVVSVIILSLVNMALGRYQRRLKALATTDQLTGLLNRRGFDMLAQQAVQESQREHSPLCALLMDLDKFKNLNDSHGHMAGDEVLRCMASKLLSHVRQSDILCRWGGEEFILLLKNTDAAQAQEVGEKIRSLIDHCAIPYQGVTLHISTSIGLAQLQPGESIDQLITRADHALYRAKQRGRNCLYAEPA
ncbi:sensor domain-containing diguanylate cyclase [Pseudomonas sp. 5P_3.1_Bac2]|uniref:sensor domain-containing diguanylate cyclase n=1 Tax=Pseudomonas sp. 5P_3.1_Bac2 TaxID=2971617 RepID=UPI0021C85FF9|nr:sensor domain-containing diguanylate cyclase [Pseudomonas sp. 5P_3.1_Bac2]MCU1715905.1 sensor domain-containing diguanylate cyclase [Pseudomonas sp. 5P_3.1_Bac2]